MHGLLYSHLEIVVVSSTVALGGSHNHAQKGMRRGEERWLVRSPPHSTAALMPCCRRIEHQGATAMNSMHWIVDEHPRPKRTTKP